MLQNLTHLYFRANKFSYETSNAAIMEFLINKRMQLKNKNRRATRIQHAIREQSEIYKQAKIPLPLYKSIRNSYAF